MKISEVIEMAKYGELNQLVVKDDSPAIISFINLGLIELHKRFSISVKEYVVTLVEGQTIYTLPADLVLIDSVFAESGEEILINNEDDPLGVMTPSYNTIQVPNPEVGTAISIIYVAYPEYVTSPDEDLALPLTLLEALLHYIGYRAHSGIDTTSTESNQNQSIHYIRFDASCKKARELGVMSIDNPTNRKLKDRGYV